MKAAMVLLVVLATCLDSQAGTIEFFDADNGDYRIKRIVDHQYTGHHYDVDFYYGVAFDDIEPPIPVGGLVSIGIVDAALAELNLDVRGSRRTGFFYSAGSREPGPSPATWLIQYTEGALTSNPYRFDLQWGGDNHDRPSGAVLSHTAAWTHVTRHVPEPSTHMLITIAVMAVLYFVLMRARR